MTKSVRAVSVHEAKTHLSRLLVAVAGGEEITIERSGRPVARLVPTDTASDEQRTPGEDRIVMRKDFDSLPKSIRQAFGAK